MIDRKVEKGILHNVATGGLGHDPHSFPSPGVDRATAYPAVFHGRIPGCGKAAPGKSTIRHETVENTPFNRNPRQESRLFGT